MGALLEHEGALRASLQAEYRLRLLRFGRTKPHRSPAELGDLVVNLPPGCALWRATGGAIALSTEAHLLRESIYRLEVLDWHAHNPKGQTPTRIDLPPLAHRTHVEDVQMNAKARAWEARQARQARVE